MKQFYVLFSILILGLFYTTWKLEIFPGSTGYYDRQRQNERNKFYQELTGLHLTTDKLLFGHYSERGFNGDGYSVSIYSLTEETAKLFFNPDKNFFTSYPIKPDYRSHWQSKHWDTSPIKENEKLFLDFALMEFTPTDEKEAKELEDNFNSIRKMLSQEGNYYAYHYYMHDNDMVGDIDFYVVSPSDRKLITINHNT